MYIHIYAFYKYSLPWFQTLPQLSLEHLPTLVHHLNSFFLQSLKSSNFFLPKFYSDGLKLIYSYVWSIWLNHLHKFTFDKFISPLFLLHLCGILWIIILRAWAQGFQNRVPDSVNCSISATFMHLMILCSNFRIEVLQFCLFKEIWYPWGVYKDLYRA